MTGTFGRVREIRLLMVTGNRNGTAGFAMTRSKAGRGPQAFQRATNRAGAKLITIDLYEDRTIFHNFFSNFGGTTIIAEQKPKGRTKKSPPRGHKIAPPILILPVGWLVGLEFITVQPLL